jgi:hypothetical protein
MTDPTDARPDDEPPTNDEPGPSEPPEDESPFEVHLLDKLEEAELDDWGES